MSKAKYKVTIPDIDYYQREIECLYGCPVKTDARGYVLAIARGDYEEAYKIARGPNPFASICGRVCAAPCEVWCRRGDIDAPIAIRALKRFVTERYGVERNLLSEFQRGKGDEVYKEVMRGDYEEQEESRWDIHALKKAVGTTGIYDGDTLNIGEKVAIVGSGCAGMSAAHDLALMGHQVTVFESAPIPGGMLTLGVPIFRLSRDLVFAEIAAILDLGVELKLNTTFGEDVTWEELQQQGFKAIFIAVGLHRGRKLTCEGSDLHGIHEGVVHLRKYNLGEKLDYGERILVIGGGDVAMDCARTSLRLPSTREVRVMCLETKDTMPAQDVEVEEAIEDGVQFHYARGITRVLGSRGHVVGVETLAVESIFDSNGRFNPTYKHGTEMSLEVDTLLLAIGQTSDLSFIEDSRGIEVDRGLIKADPDTLETGMPGVFAGGDIVLGPKLFIDAVLQGQIAARSIHKYLTGEEFNVIKHGSMMPQNFRREIPDQPTHRMYEDYIAMQRESVPAAEPQARVKGNEIIEHGYTEEMAKIQGQRCLKCSTNVIFNGDLCIMCNGCVHVCPQHCLKLVPIDSLECDNRQDLEKLIKTRYGLTWEDMQNEDVKHLGTAMLMDIESCIRCALCAKICPTDAITMEEFSFREECVIE